MTTESTPNEGQSPASGPIAPEPYTHLTLTFREPLEPVETAIKVVVEVELSEPIDPDDIKRIGEYLWNDDVAEVYQALDEAITAAGRQSIEHHFESGDLYVLAWTNANGVLVLDHTYTNDTYTYLEDLPWLAEWRYHRGA